MIGRPFTLSDHGDEIGEIRSRANRLERMCFELAAELSDLVDQTLSLAACPRDEPSVLLSVKECAELLGLSRTTTFSLIRDGALRSVKVGSRRLVPRTAMERFVIDGADSTSGIADQRRAV
jgi:excisionase family DNA binding protein